MADAFAATPPSTATAVQVHSWQTAQEVHESGHYIYPALHAAQDGFKGLTTIPWITRAPP